MKIADLPKMLQPGMYGIVKGPRIGNQPAMIRTECAVCGSQTGETLQVCPDCRILIVDDTPRRTT